MNANDESTAGRLQAVDSHLRLLHKFLLEQLHSLTPNLDIDLADPSSDLLDYALETDLHFILSKDDPDYEDESDNILTTRSSTLPETAQEGWSLASALSEIDSSNFRDMPSHPLQNQGWLAHDVMEHSYGANQQAIGHDGLLRVGEVWVDVIIRRQYLFNLSTGQFEK